MLKANYNPLIKSETIEVQVTVASAVLFKIGRIPQLDGKKITGIEVHSIDTVTKSPLSSNTNVSNNALKESFLTLEEYNGKQSINLLPMNALVAFLNDGKRMDVGNKIFNYENSKITTASNANNAVNTSYLITFYYYDPSNTEDVAVVTVNA